MRWGSQLKVPFEPGELVQVNLFGKPGFGFCEPVIGEVKETGEGREVQFYHNSEGEE